MPLTHLALCQLVRGGDGEARLLVEEARAGEHVRRVPHLVVAAAGHGAANRRGGKSECRVEMKTKINAQGCVQNACSDTHDIPWQCRQCRGRQPGRGAVLQGVEHQRFN